MEGQAANEEERMSDEDNYGKPQMKNRKRNNKPTMPVGKSVSHCFTHSLPTHPFTIEINWQLFVSPPPTHYTMGKT